MREIKKYLTHIVSGFGYVAEMQRLLRENWQIAVKKAKLT